MQKPGVAEVYSWKPPSNDELKLRRVRQVELDKLSAQIEREFENNKDMTQSLEDLEAATRRFDVELAEMEKQLTAKVSMMAERNQKLGMSTAELQSSKEALEEDILKVKRDRARRVLSMKHYSSAVLFFRDGKFSESANSFQRALSLNPPGKLIDKMYFGAGCAQYKLKHYAQAAKSLNTLVGRFPKSDKWYLSSALLGLVHNDMGEKSKAIFALENALGKSPPDSIKPVLEKLLEVINEETPQDKANNQ